MFYLYFVWKGCDISFYLSLHLHFECDAFKNHHQYNGVYKLSFYAISTAQKYDNIQALIYESSAASVFFMKKGTFRLK